MCMSWGIVIDHFLTFHVYHIKTILSLVFKQDLDDPCLREIYNLSLTTPLFLFHPLYSAFLGGQMGFFLGASLITLSELLETLLYSVYVFLNKKLTRMGQLKKKPAASASKTSAQSHNNVAANSRSNATNVIPIKQAW